MGDGTVVLTGEEESSVRVNFDRDHAQRKVLISELSLISKPTPALRQIRANPDEALIIAAWVTAFLFPVVGFICGAILTGKGQVRHGVGSMILSLLVVFIWAAILI
jgi:hypothetical protein